jgi:hypothetical protein
MLGLVFPLFPYTRTHMRKLLMTAAVDPFTPRNPVSWDGVVVTALMLQGAMYCHSPAISCYVYI